MRDAVIATAVRTAVGKAPNGALRHTRPDDMAAAVLREALRRAPAVDPAEIEDVILGCAMPEAEQGLNVARIASLRAGLPVSASALTINRFCASGLEAIACAAERVRAGTAEAILAGGTESMSLVPMGGHKIAPNPHLVATYPDVYLSTGLVAENHARESGISRDAQDLFALESHRRAIGAIDAGRFRDEILALDIQRASNFELQSSHFGLDSGALRTSNVELRTSKFEVDEGPRRDTSLEALAKLRPAFHVSGTVTAGNSSQISDGAAAVLVMSAERAAALRLTPLARVAGYATAGVPPELFGLGPIPAIRKVLRQTGLTLDQIDLIELNEAFAAQALACLKGLPIDPDRLNVNGGAIALGHPLGCTGARLTATLVHEMARRNARYGMVTLCVGGGMGAAMIFEKI
jgi:acetyl-CoA acyltransferase